jgi:hypothetical protein
VIDGAEGPAEDRVWEVPPALEDRGHAPSDPRRLGGDGRGGGAAVLRRAALGGRGRPRSCRRPAAERTRYAASEQVKDRARRLIRAGVTAT